MALAIMDFKILKYISVSPVQVNLICKYGD